MSDENLDNPVNLVIKIMDKQSTELNKDLLSSFAELFRPINEKLFDAVRGKEAENE